VHRRRSQVRRQFQRDMRFEWRMGTAHRLRNRDLPLRSLPFPHLRARSGPMPGECSCCVLCMRSLAGLADVHEPNVPLGRVLGCVRARTKDMQRRHAPNVRGDRNLAKSHALRITDTDVPRRRLHVRLETK
jgi:hypothetical protein